MDYIFYRLKFSTGIHLGNGMLNDTGYTFGADTLFSALYIEALKMKEEKRFMAMVNERQLCLSDAFPYKKREYMLPKPMLYIEPKQQGDSVEKKKYKRLKYIPIKQFRKYLAGNLSLDRDPMADFGREEQQTMVAIRGLEETRPFHIGTWYYKEGNGLYIIVGYEGEEVRRLFEQLLQSLSYVGIGGKRGSGLGKFEFQSGKCGDAFNKRLTLKVQEGKTYMLLSRALPQEEELSKALEGASYLLEKRSGFVASHEYAIEERRKKDCYVFAAGSCFKKNFKGQIVDVANGGNHPVYLYAMPLFMEVEANE